MSRDLLHVVTERADTLLAHVPGALHGDPRDTHQARVAARRLAEVLSLGGRDCRRLEREVRDLRRGLGAARELDVARGLLDDEARERHWPDAAVRRVAAHLDRERAARESAARRALDGLSLSKLRRRIRAAGEEAADLPPADVRAGVKRHVKRRDAAVRRAVLRAGALYDPERLHDVRLSVKKLRYALEAASLLTGASLARQIESLRSEQGVLGDMHDLQVLLAHVQIVESRIVAGRGSVARALAAMTADLDTKCRTLHAEWMKRWPRKIRRMTKSTRR